MSRTRFCDSAGLAVLVRAHKRAVTEGGELRLVTPADGAMRDRAVRGLTDIGRRSRGGTAVVISHDAVNRQVLVAFDPGLGDPGTLPQDNGCFNVLELRGGSWTVLSVNEQPALL